MASIDDVYNLIYDNILYANNSMKQYLDELHWIIKGLDPNPDTSFIYQLAEIKNNVKDVPSDCSVIKDKLDNLELEHVDLSYNSCLDKLKILSADFLTFTNLLLSLDKLFKNYIYSTKGQNRSINNITDGLVFDNFLKITIELDVEIISRYALYVLKYNKSDFAIENITSFESDDFFTRNIITNTTEHFHSTCVIRLFPLDLTALAYFALNFIESSNYELQNNGSSGVYPVIDFSKLWKFSTDKFVTSEFKRQFEAEGLEDEI